MTTPQPSDERFCPHCDVSMSLHDGPDSCGDAGGKAFLIELFGRPGAGRVLGERNV